METSMRKLLARLRTRLEGDQSLYVTGSGLVNVPRDRMNEIPKIIAEHHALDAERAKQLAAARIRHVR